MTGWLKVAPQVGSQVRTASVRGTAQSVTKDHVLIQIKGWGNQSTSVWVARNQLKGMYR